MGYRNYIGFIPKREYNKIKSLPLKELYALHDEEVEDGYVGPYDFLTKLYEFGKYCDFDANKYKHFFKNKEVKERYREHDFFIVDKEFLESVIKHYTGLVKEYYTKLLTDIDPNNKETFTDEKFSELYMHIRDFSSEWNYLTPYSLDHGDQVTDSWKYEYAIFELVRIYKHFDWKKNIMVYYGY